jgi:hypothetical protein
MGTGSFPGVRCGLGMPLTPHPLLVTRSKIVYSYTSTLPKGLCGLWKGEIYLPTSVEAWKHSYSGDRFLMPTYSYQNSYYLMEHCKVQSILLVTFPSTERYKLTQGRQDCQETPCLINTGVWDTQLVVMSQVKRRSVRVINCVLLNKWCSSAILLQRMTHAKNVGETLYKKIPYKYCCVNKQQKKRERKFVN